MIGWRYRRLGDKGHGGVYEVVGPASEIGSAREWVLKNADEKDDAKDLIVSAAELENPKVWQRLD